MTKDGFGICALAVGAVGWALGAFAGTRNDSLATAALVAFAVPVAILVFATKPISRAWWAINSVEAAAPDFGGEAKRSLRFVVVLTVLMSVVFFFGLGGGIKSAALAGSFLSAAVFAVSRLADLRKRNFP